MRKRYILALTVFFILLFSVPASAASYNERESNNTVGSADPVYIASGNTINGTFSSRDDYDWYKFTLSKGAYIDLTFTSTGSAEGKGYRSEMYITDSNHIDTYEYLYEFTYNSNLGYAYGKEKLYLGQGTYYIRLSTHYYSFSYRISINSVSYCEDFAEPNDYVSQATSISDGIVYNGIFASYCGGNKFDKDFFKFYSPTGGKYNVTFTNIDAPVYGGFNPYIKCVDQYGEDLYIFGEYPHIEAGLGQTSTKQATFPAGYTYFYAVASYSAPKGAGRYLISISKASSGSSSANPVATQVIAKPSKVTGVKLTRKKPKYVKVTWTAKSGVTGYKVYRSKKKNSGYKLIKTVKGANKRSFVDKGTRKGKRYYYKIRAYRNYNGSSYLGTLSAPKTIRR